MIEERSYQRSFLRAPYRKEILLLDNDNVLCLKALNLSEGGALVEFKNTVKLQSKEYLFLLELPQFPYFKNYTLEKFKVYSKDLLPSKFVRFKARNIRTFSKQESNGESSLMGLQIQEIIPFERKKIAKYVEIFSSNIIYLLVLIDSLDTDTNNLEKVKILSNLLGYENVSKISVLRKVLENDYKSLQWL